MLPGMKLPSKALSIHHHHLFTRRWLCLLSKCLCLALLAIKLLPHLCSKGLSLEDWHRILHPLYRLLCHSRRLRNQRNGCGLLSQFLVWFYLPVAGCVAGASITFL